MSGIGKKNEGGGENRRRRAVGDGGRGVERNSQDVPHDPVNCRVSLVSPARWHHPLFLAFFHYSRFLFTDLSCVTRRVTVHWTHTVCSVSHFVAILVPNQY